MEKQTPSEMNHNRIYIILIYTLRGWILIVQLSVRIFIFLVVYTGYSLPIRLLFYNSMFKKKPRKQQGVLQLNQEPTETPQTKQSSSAVHNATSHNTQPSKSTENISTKNAENQVQLQRSDHLRSKNESYGQQLANMPKRSRNADDSYIEDADQKLQNEPIRRQKQTLNPLKDRKGLGSSTFAKNQQLKQQVHEAFSDRTYRAGNNLIQDLNLQEDELQEQRAKRLFLQNVQKTKLVKEGKLNTKIYRGANAYANHQMTTNDIENAQDAYKKKMGPSRVNSTIKNSCRFDYVLNLCKDWHDSGYCPFGNSCLYLHDRSNYKTGWELQKQFEQQQRQRWKRINNPDLAKKEDKEKLLKTIQKHKPPQFCEECRQDFKNPVEVDCGHIFCTPCAIKLLKCKVCNKRLSGIMNNATEKLAKLKHSYEQMAAKLESQQQQVSHKRRRFENVDALDVFAD